LCKSLVEKRIGSHAAEQQQLGESERPPQPAEAANSAALRPSSWPTPLLLKAGRAFTGHFHALRASEASWGAPAPQSAAGAAAQMSEAAAAAAVKRLLVEHLAVPATSRSATAAVAPPPPPTPSLTADYVSAWEACRAALRTALLSPAAVSAVALALQRSGTGRGLLATASASTMRVRQSTGAETAESVSASTGSGHGAAGRGGKKRAAHGKAPASRVRGSSSSSSSESASSSSSLDSWSDGESDRSLGSGRGGRNAAVDSGRTGRLIADAEKGPVPHSSARVDGDRRKRRSGGGGRHSLLHNDVGDTFLTTARGRDKAAGAGTNAASRQSAATTAPAVDPTLPPSSPIVSSALPLSTAPSTAQQQHQRAHISLWERLHSQSESGPDHTHTPASTAPLFTPLSDSEAREAGLLLAAPSAADASTASVLLLPGASAGRLMAACDASSAATAAVRRALALSGAARAALLRADALGVDPILEMLSALTATPHAAAAAAGTESAAGDAGVAALHVHPSHERLRAQLPPAAVRAVLGGDRVGTRNLNAWVRRMEGLSDGAASLDSISRFVDADGTQWFLAPGLLDDDTVAELAVELASDSSSSSDSELGDNGSDLVGSDGDGRGDGGGGGGGSYYSRRSPHTAAGSTTPVHPMLDDASLPLQQQQQPRRSGGTPLRAPLNTPEQRPLPHGAAVLGSGGSSGAGGGRGRAKRVDSLEFEEDLRLLSSSDAEADASHPDSTMAVAAKVASEEQVEIHSRLDAASLGGAGDRGEAGTSSLPAPSPPSAPPASAASPESALAAMSMTPPLPPAVPRASTTSHLPPTAAAVPVRLTQRLDSFRSVRSGAGRTSAGGHGDVALLGLPPHLQAERRQGGHRQSTGGRSDRSTTAGLSAAASSRLRGLLRVLGWLAPRQAMRRLDRMLAALDAARSSLASDLMTQYRWHTASPSGAAVLLHHAQGGRSWCSPDGSLTPLGLPTAGSAQIWAATASSATKTAARLLPHAPPSVPSTGDLRHVAALHSGMGTTTVATSPIVSASRALPPPLFALRHAGGSVSSGLGVSVLSPGSSASAPSQQQQHLSNASHRHTGSVSGFPDTAVSSAEGSAAPKSPAAIRSALAWAELHMALVEVRGAHLTLLHRCLRPPVPLLLPPTRPLSLQSMYADVLREALAWADVQGVSPFSAPPEAEPASTHEAGRTDDDDTHSVTTASGDAAAANRPMRQQGRVGAAAPHPLRRQATDSRMSVGSLHWQPEDVIPTLTEPEALDVAAFPAAAPALSVVRVQVVHAVTEPLVLSSPRRGVAAEADAALARVRTACDTHEERSIHAHSIVCPCSLFAGVCPR
jgi:hypothetical protein